MKTRTALTLSLTMSGKYDVPGKFLIVKGCDAWGRETEEKIPVVDSDRLQADLEKMLGDQAV